jgi:hypothetical protein
MKRVSRTLLSVKACVGARPTRFGASEYQTGPNGSGTREVHGGAARVIPLHQEEGMVPGVGVEPLGGIDTA